MIRGPQIVLSKPTDIATGGNLMGAWVATVLRDLFHDTGSPFSPPPPGTADAARPGNAFAGAGHGR